MFNFGESIRRWVKLFFSNREAYILLGGELTKKILLEQGVPQGDIVSPYIFILAVEILLIKINHTYAKKESRSETFADDTSIFIQRNPKYLRECVNILKQCANVSILQCNLEKTSVIPIRGNFDTSDKLCPELSLKWESEFTLLSFQIDSRLNNLEENYQKCFERVHAISRKWARYQL